MATCEVCENEYGKAFEVVVGAEHYTSTASNARFTHWRRFVRIATAESLGTVWKPMDKSSAAFTACAESARRN
jgi:hypothetical protein